MITPAEKQRLMQQHDSEPATLYAAVFKCAAVLLVVALIAVIGVHGQSGSPVEAGVAKRVAPESRTSASIADARKLMEERRARFDQRANGSGAQAAPRPLLDPRGAEPHAVEDLTLLRRESD